MSGTITGPDGKPRCRWCGAAPEFLAYHDTEWGFPVSDDSRLFEKLSLEGFQSGLSWRTILAKRENFRAAFHDFDFDRIARFTPRDLDRLLNDEGIVRHRGKIEAVINNAERARDLVKREGSLAASISRYEPDSKQLAKPQTVSTSAEAVASLERPEEAGLEIRRADRGVRLHASHGAGQRSCRGLRDQSQSRARAQEFQATRMMLSMSPNNRMHADSKKRCSFLALLFAAGDAKRYISLS